MLILFALGAMSFVSMLIVTGLILRPQVFPFGDRLQWPLFMLFVGLAAWIAIAPGSVPALVELGQRARESHAPISVPGCGRASRRPALRL